MSTVTLEHAVGAALDVQLAADLNGDMVNVARTLFALPVAPVPAPIPAPAPIPPEAAHLPAAVPVAIPTLAALPAPPALPMPSALPVPALEVPALPADPAEDVVAIPASRVAPHSMAMLSEIAFLDD